MSPTDRKAVSLDPDNWDDLRVQGHRMLDDMFDNLATLRERPLWAAPTAEARGRYRVGLPRAGGRLEDAHAQFMADVAPHGSGNRHPGFMGWVQGGGTAVGMLAEMLAGGLDANLGGRDHMPIEVERQVVAWMAELFGFPADASGIFLTGTSLANLCAVMIARDRALGVEVRAAGVRDPGVAAYASKAVHACIVRAMDMTGLGTDRLRLIETDTAGRISRPALEQAITADRTVGIRPFLVVGSAGTVDIGAVDDLDGLAVIAAREGATFHVDGALGALGVLAPQVAPSSAPTAWRSTSTSSARRPTTPASCWCATPPPTSEPSRTATRPTCGTPSGGWRAAIGGLATSARTCRGVSGR
jgi:aromatic-L-amino-acid decarboxylase